MPSLLTHCGYGTRVGKGGRGPRLARRAHSVLPRGNGGDGSLATTRHLGVRSCATGGGLPMAAP